MAALPIGRVLAGINEAFAESLGKVFEPSKILVVSRRLARQQGVQGVVEVIVPLRVQPVAPGFGGRMKRTSLRSLSAIR